MATGKSKTRSKNKMDRGWSWVVLLGVFNTALLVRGFMQSVGVYFVYWMEEFEATAQGVGWTSSFLTVGFVCAGLLTSLLSSHVSCRWLVISGGILASASLTCAHLVTQLFHIYIIMASTGIGTGLAFINGVAVIGFYFKKKVALAMGLGLSGAGCGLFIFAPLAQYLTVEYSWRSSLTLCGALLANLCVCGALFRPTEIEQKTLNNQPRPDVEELPLKTTNKMVNENGDNEQNQLEDTNANTCTRMGTPPSGESRLPVPKNMRKQVANFFGMYKIMFTVRFTMIGVVCPILTGIGFFPVVIYFVSNAVNIDISKTDAAFLLSTMGICGLVGQLGYGPFIDRKIISPHRLAALLLFISGVPCLFVSLAINHAGLVAFCVFFGFAARTRNAVNPIVVRTVVGIHQMKKGFGIATVTGNIGALVGIPLAGYLFDTFGDYAVVFYAAGSANLLNGIIHLLDPIWAKIDQRRPKAQKLEQDD